MELVKRDYKVDDMLLREVNGELVRKFDLYLKTEKHCAQNTVIPFKKVIPPLPKQQISKPKPTKPDMKEFRKRLVQDVFIFCKFRRDNYAPNMFQRTATATCG